ncbi:unnamed protein product [[Actinomadura] parvosata subsp. kistnae]|nr:unnamed protein product [Actinomadura parvosata subsp. kistnae]
MSFSAAVKAAGYRWPWRAGNGTEQEARERLWARLFVLGSALLLGALVAAAVHGQMSGPWPAFLLGVGSEASVRGILAGVEVAVRKPEDTISSPPDTAATPAADTAGGDERANSS